MIKREYWDLKLLKAQKDRYKEQVARVDQMPEDYQTAYEEISQYIMSMYGGFDGLDAMEVIYQLVDAFEESIAEGITAQEFTGEDTSAFAKDLMDAADIPNWADKRKKKLKDKLNRNVLKKLKGEN